MAQFRETQPYNSQGMELTVILLYIKIQVDENEADNSSRNLC